MGKLKIVRCNYNNISYCTEANHLVKSASKFKEVGIVSRDFWFLTDKFLKKDAYMALDGNKLAGFCYLDFYDREVKNDMISISSLLLKPEYYNYDNLELFKKKVFKLTRRLYPKSELFELTVNKKLLKVNHELGYIPIHYTALPTKDDFWEDCKSCLNHSLLESKNRMMCLCTSMIFKPKKLTLKEKIKSILCLP